jgi:hypothetical protein
VADCELILGARPIRKTRRARPRKTWDDVIEEMGRQNGKTMRETDMLAKDGIRFSRWTEGRAAYRALVGKPEGRRPLGIPRRRWEDNIRMDLREVWMGGHGLNQSGSG